MCAVKSQTPALILGLGADLRPKPGQRRQVLPGLWCTVYRDQIKSNGPDDTKGLYLARADGQPCAQIIHLPLADGQQGLSMSRGKVCPLLGRFTLQGLKDQAAAGFLNLDIRAAVGLVGEVALQHALTSPLLPDQAG